MIKDIKTRNITVDGKIVEVLDVEFTKAAKKVSIINVGAESTLPEIQNLIDYIEGEDPETSCNFDVDNGQVLCAVE